MAGIAYVATRAAEPTEREVTTVARTEPAADPRRPPRRPRRAHAEASEKSASRASRRSPWSTGPRRTSRSTTTPASPGWPGARRQAAAAGWQVVGSDNWYGTIPTSTVYYPERLEAAAKALALDLGIPRISPAVDPMRGDRLTVILTADAA